MKFNDLNLSIFVLPKSKSSSQRTVNPFHIAKDEMQINSCKVFESNDFLGTFQESSGAFEYMTYGEFSDRVDRCRTVLKDLGT